MSIGAPQVVSSGALKKTFVFSVRKGCGRLTGKNTNLCVAKLRGQALQSFQAVSGDHLRSVIMNLKPKHIAGFL